MENCLKGYVGLKHCTQDAPGSGLYVNFLAGVSTELVQAVSPKEVDSFVELWDRINSRAWERIQADVSRFMQSEKKVNINTIAYQTRRLRLKRILTAADATTKYIGVYLVVPYAKYGKVDIKGIQFYSLTTGTTTLKVIDAFTGEVLLTKTALAVVVGYNLLEINLDFILNHDRIRLFVGIDGTGLSLYQTDRGSDYDWYTGSGCNECWDGYWNEDYYRLTPALYDLTADLADQLELQTYGVGVAVSAELGCGVDTYLCENKRHFAAAWQHLLAAELMKEKLGSYKLNFFANTNLEMTAELRDTFTADYEKFLKLNIQRIPVEGGQLCFNCENVTGFTYDSLV